MLHPFQKRRVVTALKSVSLEVQKGERIALLGPNGAGKTTLLKLIGGLLLPTEGEIEVNGLQYFSPQYRGSKVCRIRHE